MKGAPVVALGGLLGHLLGNWLYLQPMEQVPSDLLLVPFGCIVGFLVGFLAEASLPADGMGGLWGVLLLVALVYGGCNFDYAKGRGYRYRFQPRFVVDLEPESPTAERCGSACPPGTEWTVSGRMRIRAYRREGTVSGMRIWSSEPPPRGSNTITNNPALERFRGPTVLLGGTELGERHLKPNDVASYPIRYSYQNRGAELARDIYIDVYLIDTTGHLSTNSQVWRVR